MSSSPEGAPSGTSVTVRQLFRNVPARRKFLRSASAEASRTQALVDRYTLAYPAVRFGLRVEDREVLASTGSGDAREAVAAVYGAGRGRGDAGARPAGRRPIAESVGDDRARVGLTGQP